MQGSTRCICKYTHHLKQSMICCDECGKWQHAHCMGITPAKFAEYDKRKDLQYHCEKCEPREIDHESARAYQEDLLKQVNDEAKTSTDTGSTDDDESGLRRPSRDERKAIELEKLFEKMKQHESNQRRRKTEKKKDEIRTSDTEGNDHLESDEEQDEKKPPKPGRRGRPKGSANKRRNDKEAEESADRQKRTRKAKTDVSRQSGSPIPQEATITPLPSNRSTRRIHGRRGMRRKPKIKIDQVPEPVEINENEGSDTEDSADSGLVEECEVINLTVPLKNPYVRRKLDVAKFENVKSFGQDVTITFHDWEWRGGNNSKVIKKESDTWTSSLHKTGSGHFKKQWLMKNTEETKEVPDVNEIVLEELRKRNVDLTKIPELNKTVNQSECSISNLPCPSLLMHDSTSHHEDHSSDHSSQTSSTSQEKIWHPFPTSPTTPTQQISSVHSDTNGTPKPTEKTAKKLSLAEYTRRNKERKKREEEEKAKIEAERQKQQESRLSNDAVIAVLSSAIGAATNGSRVCEINANDIAWLSQLVGINLNNNQPANQLPIETTAESLSRLYHTSEQVLNTMRAANVLAALTAQQNMK